MSDADDTLLEIEDLRGQLQGLREKIEGDEDLFQLLQSKGDELRSSMRMSLRASLMGPLATSSRPLGGIQSESPQHEQLRPSSDSLPPRPGTEEKGDGTHVAENSGVANGSVFTDVKPKKLRTDPYNATAPPALCPEEGQESSLHESGQGASEGGEYIPYEIFKLLVDRVDLLENALQRAREDNKNLLSIINSVALNTVKITRVLPKIDGKVSKATGGLVKSQGVIVTLNRLLEDHTAEAGSTLQRIDQRVDSLASKLSTLEDSIESRLRVLETKQGQTGRGEPVLSIRQRVVSSNIVDTPEKHPRGSASHESTSRATRPPEPVGRRTPGYQGYSTAVSGQSTEPRAGSRTGSRTEPVVRAEASQSISSDAPQNSSVIHQRAPPRSFAAATPSIFSTEKTPPRAKDDQEESYRERAYASAIYRPNPRSPERSAQSSLAGESFRREGSGSGSAYLQGSADVSAPLSRSTVSMAAAQPARASSGGAGRVMSRTSRGATDGWEGQSRRRGGDFDGYSDRHSYDLGYSSSQGARTTRDDYSLRGSQAHRSSSRHQRRKAPSYLSSDFLALARKLEAAISQYPV